MNKSGTGEAEILSAALEHPPTERAAFLERACAGKPELRQQVEALIDAHERASDFMEKSPTEFHLTSTARIELPLAQKPGDTIGRYKLLQQIGEGGCGIVYMAEQEVPVRRRVALKVIKLGMDTKEVIARFEAERQALALMDHPNIAKVLDAGATDTGRPYFVMELVRGLKITQFCDENTVSTEERLKLFVQVCKAIQHAHQKGIIHRDIKPSNILVTINDGVPIPKVIDFGIAKATAGRLTDRTLFTAFEQFIGTPAYMSPEQAVMTSLDIDTRSDIYSLGVLLYELLTGKTPFDQKALLASGFDEIRRIIREEDPPRPSTRLSTLEAQEQSSVARHQQSELPRLLGSIRGDLDWIVMKCLEKDRSRRYDAANGLASDVERYISHEPVTARPPDSCYRLRKAIRRNKATFVATSLILMVLLIGVVASTWQAFRATRAEREQARLRSDAEALRLKAELERKASDEVAGFLRDMLRSAGPSVARGRDAALLRELLDNTSQRIRSELSGQPEVSGDLWMTIGQTHSDIGDHDQAIAAFESAATNYYHALAIPHRKIAVALGSLGVQQSFRERIDEGKSNAWLGLEMARQLNDRTLVAASLLRYADAFSSWGEGSALAVPYIREAVAIYQKQATNNEDLAYALTTLAGSLEDRAEAEMVMRKAQALSKKYVEGKVSTAEVANIFMLGQTLLHNNKPAEAEIELRKSLELWRKFYDQKHPYRAIVFRIFIQSLALQSKWKDAEAEIQRETIISPTNDYCSTLQVALKIHSGEWSVTSSNWLSLLESKINTKAVSFNAALTLARNGRLAEFHQCSKELVNRAGRDYQRAEQAVKAALLFPWAATNVLAGDLADFVGTSADKGTFIPWARMTQALAEYRRGNWSEAIVRANESIFMKKADHACKSSAYFIRALAQAQLHEEALARASFAQGDESRVQYRKGIILEHWNLNHYWGVRDWIIADFLRHEAETALESLSKQSQ